ncbi:MAG: hypothetical protein O3A47_11145 [Chloroflexi bacterium]|nr:hypothetical protein [Chloroflexota bacterium]
MRNTKMTYLALSIAGMVSVSQVVCAAGNTPPGVSTGRETSTKVLNNLVEHVDQSITGLEERSQERLQKIESYEDEKSSAIDEYKQASSQLGKHSAKSKLIEVMSKKNYESRVQVRETVDTVASVTANLEQLEQELKKGGWTPEALQERRVRLARSLNNLGPVIAQLESLAEDEKRSQFAAAKKTLLLYYKQLQSRPVMNANVFQSLSQTRETLDNVVVQLNVVYDLLNQQKYVLELNAHREIVELAIIRLHNATFNGERVRNFAEDMMSNVVDDDDAMSIVGESSLNSDEIEPGETSADWDVIANGKVEL